MNKRKVNISKLKENFQEAARSVKNERAKELFENSVKLLDDLEAELENERQWRENAYYFLV